jgi:hypothetical protein
VKERLHHVHHYSIGVKPPPDDASREQIFAAGAMRVRQLIANGKHKTALDQAKDLHKAHQSQASESLLIDAYAGRIENLIEQNLTLEANSLIDLVRERYPAAKEQLANLRISAAARAGNLDELLAPLNDPSVPAGQVALIERSIQDHVTDLGALARSPALPAEHPLRQAAGALQKAFDAVTSGPVPEETLTLAEVSRRSPLAAWKMLVWAIAAFYRRDDEASRRYLDAMKPESAAARLVPAMRWMVAGKAEGQLRGAAGELVSRITVNVLAVKQAVEKLDRAFEAAEHDGEILSAIRVAIQACRQYAPAQVERLKQHIAVRAALEELDVEKTRVAMGGDSLHNAYFHRLFARGLEQGGHPPAVLAACAEWDNFRIKAVEEGWFKPNGAEAATIYLHTAKLLQPIPQQIIRSFEQAVGGRNRQTAPDFFFVHPDELYERACALDPHSEAFSQWLAWAKTKGGVSAQRVAEAWHKVCPEDLEPILYLMRSYEGRGAFPTALQYLVRAERIDGVNPEVRRARLRLLAGNVMRSLQKRKAGPAEKGLDELSALPQIQQGDRPAFLAALRFLSARLRGDNTLAQWHRSQIETLLGGGAVASLLIFAVSLASKRTELHSLEPVGKLSKQERAALPAALARLVALASDVQLSLRVPVSWMEETARQFRKNHQTLDVDQLQTLGYAALESNRNDFAYAVSAAGLARGGAREAQFLLLRARTLPQANFERRTACAAAAAALARQHSQHDVAAKAVDLLSGPFRDGSIQLTPSQIAEVLRMEKKETAYPKGNRRGPRYRFITSELCSCPDCRRERGEMVDEFDDEFDEMGDDDFAFDPSALLNELDIPPDMPPAVAKVLIEETARAVASGESLEELMDRLFSDALLPERMERRKRK